MTEIAGWVSPKYASILRFLEEKQEDRFYNHLIIKLD